MYVACYIGETRYPLIKMQVGRNPEVYFFIGTLFGAEAGLYLFSGKGQIHKVVYLAGQRNRRGRGGGGVQREEGKCSVVGSGDDI